MTNSAAKLFNYDDIHFVDRKEFKGEDDLTVVQFKLSLRGAAEIGTISFQHRPKDGETNVHMVFGMPGSPPEDCAMTLPYGEVGGADIKSLIAGRINFMLIYGE